MSETAPTSNPKSLMHLVLDWTNAKTWKQSQMMLEANADRLLSGEALTALDRLLWVMSPGNSEGRTKHLLQYRTILEVALTESIDAAYAMVMEPLSPFERTMEALTDENRDELFGPL